MSTNVLLITSLSWMSLMSLPKKKKKNLIKKLYFFLVEGGKNDDELRLEPKINST